MCRCNPSYITFSIGHGQLCNVVIYMYVYTYVFFLFLSLYIEVCSSYKQEFCSGISGYSSPDTLVYVNRKYWGPGPLHLVEYDMKSTYDKVKKESSLSPGCDLALKQLICHTTLPFCSKR